MELAGHGFFYAAESCLIYLRLSLTVYSMLNLYHRFCLTWLPIYILITILINGVETKVSH